MNSAFCQLKTDFFFLVYIKLHVWHHELFFSRYQQKAKNSKIIHTYRKLQKLFETWSNAYRSNSSQMSTFNFKHFLEMLEIMFQHFRKILEIHGIKIARNETSTFDLRWAIVDLKWKCSPIEM